MTRGLSRSFTFVALTLCLVPVACDSGKGGTGSAGAGGAAAATGAAGTTASGGAGGAAGAIDAGVGGSAGIDDAGGTSGGRASGGAGSGGASGASGGAGSGGHGGSAGGQGGTTGGAGAAGRGGASGSTGAGGGSGAGGGVAATWPGTRTFGSTAYQLGTSMVVDGSGNIYLGGETRGPLYGQPQGSMNDLFALKISSGAAVQWATTTDLLGEEWGYGITLDRAGNVYLAGATWATIEAPGFEAVLVKHDSTGARQWVQTVGTARYDYARGVATDAAGHIYVVGLVGEALEGLTSAGGSDGFLAKFDGDGTRLWIRQFGTSASDFANGVAVDGGGNAYVAGYTEGTLEGTTNAGMQDGFLVKYDGAGTRQWMRMFGTAASDTAGSVAVDGAGNIYVAGGTSGDLAGTGNLGASDAYIVKFDAAGARGWTRQFGGAKGEAANDVATDAAGNIYVGGTTGGIDPTITIGSQSWAQYVAKFDSAGTFAWLRQTAQTSSFSCAIAVDPRDGHVFLTGRCLNGLDGQPCGSADMYIMKFTPEGVKL